MSGALRNALLDRKVQLPGWLRLSRYTIGSLICFAVSELSFLLLFGTHLAGARTASVLASIIGIIPGYTLNRSWTWGRRGRSDFWREVVPYWITALASAVIAAVATGFANSVFDSRPRTERMFIDAAAFMLCYGVLFLAKFAIFHWWLFAPSAADEPADTKDPVSLST